MSKRKSSVGDSEKEEAAIALSANINESTPTSTAEIKPPFIVSCGDDAFARIWGLPLTFPEATEIGAPLKPSVNCLRTYPKHHSGVLKATVHGKYLITASRDKNVRVFDCQSGELLHKLEGHTSEVWALTTFENCVYSGCWSGLILVHQIEPNYSHSAFAKIKQFQGHNNYIYDLKGIKQHNTLVSCSLDGTVRIFDIGQDYAILHSLNISGGGGVYTMTVVEDRYIIAGGKSAKLCVWDYVDKKKEPQLIQVLEGHSNNIWSLSYDNLTRTLYSGAWDRNVCAFDFETGAMKWKINPNVDNVRSVVFIHQESGISDRDILFVTGEKGVIRVFDANTRKELLNWSGHSQWVLFNVAILPTRVLIYPRLLTIRGRHKFTDIGFITAH